MDKYSKVTELSRLKPVSYTILALCMGAGLVTFPLGLEAAVLPAAVVFGWSQIGGL